MAEKERTTFDNLVSQMSPEERKELLSKMRPFEGNLEENSLESEKNPAMAADDVRVEDALKKESFIYRLILWLRSIFTSTNMHDLYNADKVMALYRKLNHEYPGLVDYKGGLLLGLMYERLTDLKKASNFFKPYVDFVYENPGAFYVYFGSFIAPEITEQMNREVDPNLLPLDRDVTNELRASYLRRMDDILKSISSEKRIALYNCAISLEWLYQFTRLPFEHIITSFSSGIIDSQVASFDSVASDLNVFAKILCNGKTVPPQVLEAIYIFSSRIIIPNDSAATDDDSRAKEFMDKSSSFMTIIHSFINTVPLRYINKVVFNNIQWQPDQFGGAEDWFVKYKDHWRHLFEEQWTQWLRNKRKNQMNTHLKECFGIEEAPLLPHRPWADMWGGLPFNYETTAGFLYWFIEQKMTEACAPLKLLLLEGQFVNKDNRVEFSDTLNNLDQVTSSFNEIVTSFSPKGQAGVIFEKLSSEHLRTTTSQAKIDSVMRDHESRILRNKDVFCNCARSIQNVLGGAFNEKQDTRYDGVQNITAIQGIGNLAFRNKLKASRKTFENALSVLKELEQIDLPANK